MTLNALPGGITADISQIIASAMDLAGHFLFSAVLILGFWSDARRRRTLRRTETGGYVWIEWHGGERYSDHDPSAPGGAWDGDGDGGD
ncbi:hypothetical protein [Cognatishimia sp. F0-27]|uniref:hypothetical protein n=1 Tax=Cognatishimia sp. F0-27 TaxID=2816855 RepID=UPI001D0C9AF9|nr:hypothetical protein [Cognatishimia sp. F0-27]MCC1494779.1 hypothetical protein [Cognatishimia sp. F0-27]